MAEQPIDDGVVGEGRFAQGGDPQQAQVVPPQPVPMTWQVERINAPDGTPLTAVKVYTPTGLDVFFLDQEFCRQLSVMFANASGGIEVAREEQLQGLPILGQ